jgi:uncharacterized protein involved in exopolysaccharide biosynthesis
VRLLVLVALLVGLLTGGGVAAAADRADQGRPRPSR